MLSGLLHVKNGTKLPSDWCRCVNCEREMLLPVGEEKCPYCDTGTLQFVLTDTPIELDDVLSTGRYFCYTFK